MNINENFLGLIATPQIDEKKGCIIKFETDSNVIKGDKLKIKFKEHNQFFEIFNLSISKDNLLVVEAKEVGYWAMKLDRRQDLDLRDLAGLKIFHIKDQKEIDKINEASCWC
jgi:hypothetical protein